MGFLDRFTSKRSTPPPGPPSPTRPAPLNTQPTSDGFGRKMAWLAVRTQARQAVIDAAGIRDVEPLVWGSAVEAAYLGRVLVTPPLNGVGGPWVLVATGEPIEVETARLLSEHLATEVQLFGNHRVSSWAQWAKADSGTLIRVFDKVDGELLGWVGAPDAHEQALGMASLAGVTDAAVATEDVDGWLFADEDEVDAIAAAWSLSPFDRSFTPADGEPLVGELG